MGHSDIVADALAGNVALVRQRIADACAVAGRDLATDPVRILAAAKYVDADTVRALLAAGVHDIAENRLDALVAKQAELAAAPVGDVAPTWHFIGRLQSRKVPELAPRVALVHTLCSESAAARLAREPAPPRALVQVNIDGDSGKDGLLAEQVEPFLASLPPEVVVVGLMTMPAFAESPQESRGAFADLRELRDRLVPAFGERHPLRELSMGTSQDFGVAVEEGATLVRLGRVLYAQR